MSKDGEITVTCTVKNTGKVKGSDVAQLYVHDLVASLAQPVKVLKDFEKFTLAPGESRTLTFTLPASALAFSDLEGNPVVEAGEFDLWVDNSSNCAKEPVKFYVK
jgi:beta-glucosidase